MIKAAVVWAPQMGTIFSWGLSEAHEQLLSFSGCLFWANSLWYVEIDLSLLNTICRGHGWHPTATRFKKRKRKKERQKEGR